MSLEKINSDELSKVPHILRSVHRLPPPQSGCALIPFPASPLPVSSHAVKVPGLIFLSGQTPVDGTGTLVEGDIGVHTVRPFFFFSPQCYRISN